MEFSLSLGYSVGPAIGGGLQEVRMVFSGTCNRGGGGGSTRGEDGIQWDLQ